MQRKYILLTSAKNEEQYIGEAIQSVLRQSILPLAWFIMDDGSTDKTAQIVQNFSEKHAFIQLNTARRGGKRSFGAQYIAINAAYDLARHLCFDYVGMHDADIVPEQDDYYETILRNLDANTKLGVAGGYIFEPSKGLWECRKANSPEAVAGGIQMFRRVCFEQIGGYTPLQFGGEDWLAQLDTKMAGWEVEAFPELPVYHYRPTSSAGGRWRGLFRLGMMDASFGSHPIFEVFKCARRIVERPLFISSIIRFAGYAWWNILRRSPLLPADKVSYLRKEQMTKLLALKLKFTSKDVKYL
ncbi:MAG: glycosyltransferase family A protein [Methylococcaceae bacterium]